MALEMNENQLERSYEKWRNITQSQRWKEYDTYNKEKEG
jgi:hypothetical protein